MQATPREFHYRTTINATYVLLGVAVSGALLFLGLVSWTVALTAPIGGTIGMRSGHRLTVAPEGITVGLRKTTPWIDVAAKQTRWGTKIIAGTGIFKAQVPLRYFDRHWQQGELGAALDEQIPPHATRLRASLGLSTDHDRADAPIGYVHHTP